MTTTEILGIPQIPVYDCGNLQNDLHIGFGTDLSKRLGALRWTDEGHTTKRFPDVVDQPIGAYLMAFSAEDQAYVIAQKSEYVRRRKQKDEERDALYKEIRKTVDTFATLSIFPEKQQKALVMQPIMQKYKIDPDGGIEAQTVATEQWLQEQQTNYQCELAARELGIYDSIQQLKTLNDEVRQLTLDRNDESAQKALAALKTARRDTDQAFNALRLILNAMALTAGNDAYTYEELIRQIQQTIKYYRQISDERRRTNLRVAVKSEAIGRHTYATVSGWTWARLIEDGKALLAIDDETEPARIVSTDKKALKLGGLVLTLDGAAVKPADEVDATREYELVAAE